MFIVVFIGIIHFFCTHFGDLSCNGFFFQKINLKTVLSKPLVNKQIQIFETRWIPKIQVFFKFVLLPMLENCCFSFQNFFYLIFSTNYHKQCKKQLKFAEQTIQSVNSNGRFSSFWKILNARLKMARAELPDVYDSVHAASDICWLRHVNVDHL